MKGPVPRSGLQEFSCCSFYKPRAPNPVQRPGQARPGRPLLWAQMTCIALIPATAGRLVKGGTSEGRKPSAWWQHGLPPPRVGPPGEASSAQECQPDLHLHGLFHSGGHVDVLDLVAQAPDAPVVRGLVDGVHNAGVEGFTLLDGTRVESESPARAEHKDSPSGAHPGPLPHISLLGPALLRPHPSYEAARRPLGRWSISLWALQITSCPLPHILQELLSGPLAFASIGFLSEEKAT